MVRSNPAIVATGGPATPELTRENGLPEASAAWGAVACMSLMTFMLIASEFLPVSLLTPIAGELGITEGQAGQGISVSGLFAVLTALFGNRLLSRLDRRIAVLIFTGILVVAGLVTGFAPDVFVFMLGRALVGVSVGGFWSLSTAIVARLVSARDLPKALAMLQGGTALATVIAAPLGAFLGGLVGWRAAFLLMVPVGIAAFVWQLAVLPRLPADTPVSVGRMFGLLRNRIFVIGMAAITLVFTGQFAISTYLRPFLEAVTGLDVNGLSLMLLGIGLAGLAGTSMVGFLLGVHLRKLLVGLPAMLALLALLLIAFGPLALPTTILLLVWGLCTTPIPVAWGTWMTRLIPHDLEAGGGLQVALIQFAIAVGGSAGGLLFDGAGWWSPFVFGSVLLAGSALLAISASRTTERPL